MRKDKDDKMLDLGYITQSEYDSACFDKWLTGILLNIAISMLTTLLLLEKLGLLR